MQRPNQAPVQPRSTPRSSRQQRGIPGIENLPRVRPTFRSNRSRSVPSANDGIARANSAEHGNAERTGRSSRSRPQASSRRNQVETPPQLPGRRLSLDDLRRRANPPSVERPTSARGNQSGTVNRRIEQNAGEGSSSRNKSALAAPELPGKKYSAQEVVRAMKRAIKNQKIVETTTVKKRKEALRDGSSSAQNASGAPKLPGARITAENVANQMRAAPKRAVKETKKSIKQREAAEKPAAILARAFQSVQDAPKLPGTKRTFKDFIKNKIPTGNAEGENNQDQPRATINSIVEGFAQMMAGRNNATPIEEDVALDEGVPRPNVPGAFTGKGKGRASSNEPSVPAAFTGRGKGRATSSERERAQIAADNDSHLSAPHYDYQYILDRIQRRSDEQELSGAASEGEQPGLQQPEPREPVPQQPEPSQPEPPQPAAQQPRRPAAQQPAAPVSRPLLNKAAAARQAAIRRQVAERNAPPQVIPRAVRERAPELRQDLSDRGNGVILHGGECDCTSEDPNCFSVRRYKGSVNVAPLLHLPLCCKPESMRCELADQGLEMVCEAMKEVDRKRKYAEGVNRMYNMVTKDVSCYKQVIYQVLDSLVVRKGEAYTWLENDVLAFYDNVSI